MDAALTAQHLETVLRHWRLRMRWDLAYIQKIGHLPEVFHESDDPHRLVPLVWEPDDYMIVVTGDLGRDSAYIFSHNGCLGYPTARNIRLPKNWASLRAGGTST